MALAAEVLEDDVAGVIDVGHALFGEEHGSEAVDK